jgi:beta-glucosidase-like glycosyl hydrolase/CubicO group peptidase (beta-lactamase class C family)
MLKNTIKIITSLFFVTFLYSGGTRADLHTPTPQTSWADSVLNTLSLEEKIAQLIMIRAHSDKNTAYNDSLIQQVKRYQVGGACFFQGGPARQAELTNRMQKVSRIPVMIGIDGEWGLAMRLDSVQLFPRQMALGAGRDFYYIYKMGCEIARQCKRMGIHVNFAPCVDINSNSSNPVIGSRSFGSEPQLVTQCGIAYMKGLQDNGVMACAKHFPGHGDTEADSHDKLPTINYDFNTLKNRELYPFRKLIYHDVDAVMVGHLNIPVLDSNKNSIATTSRKITTELLQNEMNFNGLIFTDGLEMKGIAKFFQTGDLEVRTLMAGCDVLLLPGDLNIVIPKIREAVENGVISVEDINKKCLKVLKMKEKYVLPNAQPVQIENITKDINSPDAKEIYTVLTQKSITVLQNKNNILPLSSMGYKKVVHLRGDKSNASTLQNTIKDFFEKHYVVDISTYQSKESFTSNTTYFLDKAKDADYVIVSLHNTSQYAKNQYGLEQKTIQFLDTLTKMKENVILVIMNNPYCLNYIPFTDRFASIILGYHPVSVAEEAVGKIILGDISPNGKLPIYLNNYPAGTGDQLEHGAEIVSSLLDEMEYNFSKIDEMALNGIKQGAYPGCRILVAYKGHAIYNKSFGTFGYSDSTEVTKNTIYDLASITKIAATTLAVMKLYDEGKIDVKNKLSDYLPYLKGTNKENITIASIMTHTAGLQAWIPFYKKTNIFDTTLYRTVETADFQTKICENLYIKNSYKDIVIRQIVESKLKDDNHYLYSDLGFYLLAELVKKISGKPLDKYVEDNFYRPMGLTRTLFNPLEYFKLSDIPPTENDTIFRKTLVQGYVHDQGAAMLGGVSGHAGLFSTANGLWSIAEMLLHKGVYGNKRYLSENTVDFFTSYYFPNGDCRRGLGFDKPAREKDKSPCSKHASSKSYGHSGFTGTFIWIDPEYDLVYIFLSNRIHPDAENKRITEMNIRTGIQDVIYKVMKK